MNWGELDVLDEEPLAEIQLLVSTRDVAHDLVDADMVEAVARAREAGVAWGTIAVALRGTREPIASWSPQHA